MKFRQTKQKDIILDVLKQDKTHPTICELYQKVSKVDPKIGQATVYRNVNKLVEIGQVVRIPSLENGYHYDGNCEPHAHFICKHCHRIIDLDENDYSVKIKEIEKKHSIKIEQYTTIYEGVCQDCNIKLF